MDNKFIQQLKGETAVKSSVQVNNDNLNQVFDNYGIIDQRESVRVVAKGATNLVLSGENEFTISDVDELTGEYNAVGQGLWVNATHTYTDGEVFTPNTKFVLRLCGNNLLKEGIEPINVSVIVSSGATVIASKTTAIAQQGNCFCRVVEFESDLTESVKIAKNGALTVQVLCGDENTSATIFLGKTVLTILQRKIDADAVANNESTLQQFMSGEVIPESLLETIDGMIDTAVAVETVARENADTALDGKISAEITARENADADLNNAVNSLSGQVGTINGKIPSQASSSNKLADKNFVNSSIATNTANFKGTFNSLAELEAVADPTPNDYGFVIGTDAQGNTVYNRYKYTGPAWAFEYALNNSSFTATQWAAVNSGITDELVEKIGKTSGKLLLEHFWSDHLINDQSYLRADTFSWQNGSVYQTAYKHLRNDMYNWYSWENNGTTIYTKKAYPVVGEKAYSNSALTTEVGEITAVTDTLDITVEKITVNNVVYDSVSGGSITPITETVGGVTIQYIPAEDGHKIVTLFYESEVADIYTATGIAWYYIIDYGNRRFKLPRSKHEHYGNRPVIGNGMTVGWDDGTKLYGIRTNSGTTNYQMWTTANYGASIGTSASTDSQYPSSNIAIGITSDPTKSGIISTPVQDTDQYKYLYFYVGQFTQTATEQTAGLNAELFNGKQDILTGVSGGGDYVVSWQTPTAENNYTWYRKYKSGWVEQGQKITDSTSAITLPIAMANDFYTITTAQNGPVSGSIERCAISNQTTTGFTIRNTASSMRPMFWQVSGMSAQG